MYQILMDDKNKLYNYRYKTEKEYKNKYQFLKEVDSKALQSSTRNLLSAYKRFFNGLKNTQHVGFPKFKSRKGKQSYTTYNIKNNIKIDFKKKKIKLPKINEWIKFRDNRIFKEEIKKITISKTKSGNYFASIMIERDITLPKKLVISSEEIQAFDMSFPYFLVSPQNRMKNPHFYRNKEKKIRQLQRNVSRKKPGSQNREKARIRLARKYDQIHNRKKDWTHKISHKLANKYKVIILEDLNITGMMKFAKGHAKTVTLDFSWNFFVFILRYKMEQRGNYLILINQWFPSSKLCSQCGWKNTTLEISYRVWKCQNCHTVHDRDENASKNLLMEGLKQIKGLPITIIPTVGTTGSYAWEDYVRRS